VEEGNPGVREEMSVEVEIVGVKEGLGGEGFFDDGVGRTEEKDAGPAAASAADDFAYEECTAAVHGSHDDEGYEHFERQVAEEVFRDEGRGEDEGDGGADAAVERGGLDGYRCGCDLGRHAVEPLCGAQTSSLIGSGCSSTNCQSGYMTSVTPVTAVRRNESGRVLA
jgi:hypothetical protein